MRHPVLVPARRSRLGRVVAAATVTGSILVAASIVVAGAPVSGAVPLLPKAVDFTTIRPEQVQIVTRDYQSGVDHASSAVSAATGALDAASGSLATDTAASASAAAHAADAAETLSTTTAAHEASVTAHSDAIATLASDRGRLAEVAVALYLGPPPEVPDVAADVTGAQAAGDAGVYLDTSRRQITALVNSDVRNDTATARAERQLAGAVAQDQTALTGADAASRQAEALAVADRTAVATDQGTVAASQKTLATAQQVQTTALGDIGTPAADGSPTIMGTAALEPAQLAGWFNSGYYHDLTQATVAQLTGWYVSEGTAEGVRGDVAFAQAVVETGGFSSPDAIGLNNYAGIGHCDTCAAGLAFPTPQGGVRGQIQVLRIFASPAGTPLTQPAVIPAVAPGGQFRGACCPSWQSLTGTYATDPNYGQTVLTVYKSMLDYALSQPPVAPTPPITTPATPPATS